MSLALINALLVAVLGTIVLLAASKVDIETREVPTWVQGAMLTVFIISVILQVFLMGAEWTQFLYQLVQGCVVLVLLLIFCAFTEKGNGEEMLGGGDIRMLALVALLVTTEQLLGIIVVASFVMIFYALSKKKDGMDFKTTSLPYMPFLTVGWVVVEVWAIINMLL